MLSDHKETKSFLHNIFKTPPKNCFLCKPTNQLCQLEGQLNGLHHFPLYQETHSTAQKKNISSITIPRYILEHIHWQLCLQDTSGVYKRCHWSSSPQLNHSVLHCLSQILKDWLLHYSYTYSWCNSLFVKNLLSLFSSWPLGSHWHTKSQKGPFKSKLSNYKGVKSDFSEGAVLQVGWSLFIKYCLATVQVSGPKSITRKLPTYTFGQLFIFNNLLHTPR